ncbi:DNA polymerase III subunit alpha [Candidatus Uhrbacteria bacterium]|nr:MAG: DNA polymerase III subunit alpha [Candidatus Uhrbacteria bacterium]
MPDSPAAIEKSPFVHLHVQSMYSLYDGIGSPDDLVERAKELGYDAIALTDRHALYGAVEFYEAAHKAGIKPIIGVLVSVAPNKHTDKRPGIDNHTSNLTLLCETNEGYRNLLKLISISYLDGFYYRPRVDKELLRTHRAGLIALSGDLKGEIPKALASHDMERAEKLAAEYRELFGPDHFFLELLHQPESPSQNEVNQLLIELGKKTGTPLVVTKEVHYLNPDDAEALDVLVCIHDGKTLDDPSRKSLATLDLSLCGPGEVTNAYAHLPEAVENARKIADRCDVRFDLGTNHLPAFEVPAGETADSYLRKLCEAGLIERYDGSEQLTEAKERLEFELATIERMGFAAYFLIVADYINWAKDHGVIVGPGRGSAAGSIVAYSLRITNLDPLRYGLLFERFLNPDRISMPDIDTDFDDVKRKDVIEYVSQKYGVDRVAGIITFGTMAARAAVRDVGRVLGMTFTEVDRVAKAVPPPVQGRHIPLEKSKKDSPELRAMYESDPRVRQLIDLAIKLEGTTRHASQHACGIVISPGPLVHYSPLQKAQGGDVDQVVQYSLHSAEVMGLLKMDFLGLSNLSVIRDALEIIGAVYGDAIDMETLPLNDAKTFELLGRGETTGVFQLESDGMKKYIRELKPTVIEDIIAMVALYRPGPMQFIESFIDRKHGREKISFMHPLTENALAHTYGLPIYQEQVMQVAKDMAGFTGGEADTLRKAMGKKIAKLMAEMKVKFVAGSMKNGVERETAEAIFKQFEEFAAYGFNKSHAACYALIAYQTAYLKAHYPDAFMAALMNSDISNLDRITIEVEECRRMGLDVLPPDINESFRGFAVVKGTRKIRFGLLAIKGIGEDVVESIYRERKANGPYRDLEDFVTRVTGKHINRRSLEALIKSGALDRFGDRNLLYFNIDSILEHQKRVTQEAETGQVNLFAMGTHDRAPGTPGHASLRLKPAPPAATRDILSWEKELLGLYVSAHPFKEYAERLAGLYTPIAKLGERKKDKSVRTGGMFTQAKKILTKNNEPMVFTKLEDTTGEIEAVIFPRVYRDKPELWEADKAVILSGRVQEKDGELKFLVESGYEITPENIEEIEKYVNQESRIKNHDPSHDSSFMIRDSKPQQAVTVRLRAHLPETILFKLRAIFDAHPGQYRVYFSVDNAGGQQKILSSYRIAFDELVAKEVEAILGPDSIKADTNL